jgi:hypothetical protein
LLESLLRSCLSTQVPQASIVDEPVEIGRLPRRRKPESHSFADAEPSRGMRIELRAEDISEHDYSQFGWLDNQEHIIRKYIWWYAVFREPLLDEAAVVADG